jgi:hypothetical protein
VRRRFSTGPCGNNKEWQAKGKAGEMTGILSHELDSSRLADASPIGETLLTLASYYVGREFRFAGVRAIWMASQGQIKFYGDDSALLRIVDVGDPRQTKAA